MLGAADAPCPVPSEAPALLMMGEPVTETVCETGIEDEGEEDWLSLWKAKGRLLALWG